jgi:cell division protease FtsH
LQVRKGHSKVYQQDLVDVLDKQLLEGMGVLLTEEEQQKCEQNVCLYSFSRSDRGVYNCV